MIRRIYAARLINAETPEPITTIRILMKRVAMPFDSESVRFVPLRFDREIRHLDIARCDAIDKVEITIN